MGKCRMRAAWVAAIACAVLSGCSSDTDRPNKSQAPEPSSATGTLRGTVRLSGTQFPAPALIENTTDPELCGRVQRRQDLLVDRENRGIANVIVSLASVPAEKIPPSQPDRLVLDNNDCQFIPHVAVVSVGSTIEVVSHDSVLHTVHFYGALERNVALPDESASAAVTVGEPGMIAVLCDVHGWMKAYIRADAHPFHVVTGAEGTFVIENIPVGSYEVDVWHERLGSQSLSVRVEPETSVAVEIMYGLDGP